MLQVTIDNVGDVFFTFFVYLDAYSVRSDFPK